MRPHVVVIGAGPGGYSAAIRASQLGSEVTLIEQDKPGGVCLNWGCIPTKTLISGCNVLRKVQQPDKYGLEIDGQVSPSLSKLMSRKQRVLEDQVKGLYSLFSQYRINYLQGIATITGPNSLSVHGSEPPNTDITWDRLIIAIGSIPKELEGFSWDGQKLLNSNHALELDSIPQSLLIVGGGVIGCEFACLFSGLGTKVVLVEAMDRLLPIPGIDEECSTILLREMKKQKITCHLSTSVRTWSDQGSWLTVWLDSSISKSDTKNRSSCPEFIETEKVLLCLGRNPETSTLGLDSIGLQKDAQGWITVNNLLATNVSGVYAIGDILGPSRMMLAHAAAEEGRLAAENALGGSKKMSYDNIPSAVFTYPEVANTGLSEQQAHDLGYDIKTEKILFRTLGKAHAEGEISGQAKIVFDRKTEVILGAHLIGPRVTEYIAEMVLAINQGITIKDLAHTIHPHPTFSEILAEVSLKANNHKENE